MKPSPQEFIAKLEKAWREITDPDAAPELERFLPAPTDPQRVPCLYEIIKADMRLRGERKRQVQIEHYLSKFPELGGVSQLPPELIYEEYRVRYRLDKPALNNYRLRFPEQYHKLCEIIKEQPISRFGTALTFSFPGSDLPSPDAEASTPQASPSLHVERVAPTADSKGSLLQVGGGYELLEHIGAGGFGEVWRALAPGGVEVAVKIILRTRSHGEAFERERAALEVMRGLEYVYLLPVYAYWQLEDRLVIAMRLASGSLLDYYKKRGPAGIPVAELLRYFAEAAEAIDFLHSRQVLHRDIKPANILLMEGHALVADFGMARVIEENWRYAEASQIGTPAYMAPEILVESKVGFASDQYSLAVAYAELRLGRLPFGSGFAARFQSLQNPAKPDLAPLPAAEQDVLFRALDPQPDQRFPCCLDFVEALQETHRQSPLPPLSPPAWPWPKIVAAAASCVAVLLVVAGILLPLFITKRGPPILHMDVAETLKDVHAGRVAEFEIWSDAVGPDAQAWLHIQIEGDGVGIMPAEPRGVEPMVLALPLRKEVNLESSGNSKHKLWLISLPDSESQSFSVSVHAEGYGSPPTFESKIGPSALSMPPYQQSDTSKAVLVNEGGPQYCLYTRIDITKAHIAFVVVPTRAIKDDPKTFYMMEDKVCFALFKHFADERPQEVAHNDWKANEYRQEPATYPVRRVDVDDATRFAHWLGGKLPTRLQWEKALGFLDYPGKEGPYDIDAWDSSASARGGWNPKKPLQIASLKRDHPEPVGSMKDDITMFGCRDMAGNGREWTSTLHGSPAGMRDDNPTKRNAPACYIICGQPYTADGPLQFALLRRQKPIGSEQPYCRDLGEPASADPLSFRVVIEPTLPGAARNKP